VACNYLLAATFLRLAIPSGTLPVDPFLLAFAGVLASAWLWSRPWEHRLTAVRLDLVSCAMGMFVALILLSAVLPHAYPAGAPLDPKPFSLPRFILIGTVMPLAMFLVGRRLLISDRAVRTLLWSALAAGAYSSWVSIGQFAAPQLVWPRYIVEDPSWVGRAVGTFNQPVVNGLVLIVAFLSAVLIASHNNERPGLRVCAALVGMASVCALYLTHTRAVWLSFALVVLIGALVAKRFRSGFVLTAAAIVIGIRADWSTFSSDDRTSGGVGSVNEVQDRLNGIATSIWAFKQEPVIGWGIGRFPAVNTFHHQEFSAAIPWERGWGYSSHFDALGILAELGFVGLALWLFVYGLIYRRLIKSIPRTVATDMYGRAFALTALLVLIAQTITALTVDLRFFDFPNIIVMLFAGVAIGRHEGARRKSDQSANSNRGKSADPFASVSAPSAVET
jgi:O-antigen ligase